MSSSGKVDNDRRASELMPPPPPPPLLPSSPPKTITTPRNPTIGARYLQQQQLLLDRHRQLERIRRDEEERRQRAQDERLRLKQESSDKEEDKANMKMEEVASPNLPFSQRMKSRRQKAPVGIIHQDMNRETNYKEHEDFSKTKNGEENQQSSDYYFYYGGDDDYYSSDEESSGSSYIEPPFPPLLHDLRMDQLPRPTNRMLAGAVLPPGVRSRLQPIRQSNSKIHDGTSHRTLQVERLQELTTMENDNDPVQNESTKMYSKLSKGLKTELVVQRDLQKGKFDDTKMLPEKRKRRQDANKLPEGKTFERVQQERQENGKPNPLTEWTNRDTKQVEITSVKKSSSCIKQQQKHLDNQVQQQNSINKIMRSVPSNKGQDTSVDVEELRSVQWKAPLTQWNKRPVEYEAAVKQRYPIQKKGNDLQNLMKEKIQTYIPAKFEGSRNHLYDQQQKLKSEVERQKCERIKMKNMVFEYQKLVNTLPLNEQLQHMIQLQQYLRPPKNMIEKTTVKYNPSVQQQHVASTNDMCILLDDLTDNSQEQTVQKQISNLLLKIKYQQEEMYRHFFSDDIARCQGIVSNKLDINNVEQNDLKNWCDLWPAYEDKPKNDELMDEEQRLLRTQELIEQYYSSNNDQKSVRSLEQQKRRLGRYGRERLERELPMYQQLRIKQIKQSEISARPNLTEQQILKRQNLQHIEQNLPERQTCLDQYKRLGRIEQLEQQKHLLGNRQQHLNRHKTQQIQDKQQQNSDVGRTSIQKQLPQYCWTVSKFQVSTTLCYDEQLPLRDQLLRKNAKKKDLRVIKVIRQQQRSKSTTQRVTATRPEIMSSDASNLDTIRQKSRGSQLWWASIGLQRQISPLVTGVDIQADQELTPLAMMPLGNLPQVTRPQIGTKVASVIDVHPKNETTFTNQSKLKKWLTPRLLNMMTNVEERWLQQLQTKISQLDQQVDLHFKAMIDRQQQQVKLLLNYDRHLQCIKEKKRLERERRIQQLKKRTPFQALPVHHQQAHTLRAAGHIRQQQPEIPIIVIDDDNDEPLNDTRVVGQKQDKYQHPVFIDDDLLRHKIETKVLYEDQHKGISNRWKQLEVIRKAHQKQWELKLKNLFSYKATNRQFCRELNGRLMMQIKDPNLINALEQLNGGPLRYTERQQLEQQMLLSESQSMAEQSRMLNRQKELSQKQAVKTRSQKTPIGQKKQKKSKKTMKQQRSTLKLSQNLNYTNKNQPKKSYEHQESVNIRQLRSKKIAAVNQLSQKRSKQQNNQNQLQIQIKSPLEQQKQITRIQLSRSQLLTKVKAPVVSSRHIFLLRNRILQVHSNRNKRLRNQNQRLVPKQDVIINTTEMQNLNESTKLVLRKMAYSLHNQRSLLQRQLDRLNEIHPDKINKQIEPSVSKTLIMSVRQPLITSLILPPLQPSTVKQQSLTSTVILNPQRPLASIDQSRMSSVMLISQLPMQPIQPTASTSSVNQPYQQRKLLEEKCLALKQQLNGVHSKLKPLMEMWQLSLQMPGSWLCHQLDDIEELRRKEFSIKSMLDLRHLSGQQQKQKLLQNNEVSVLMASTSMAQCPLQQLQRIREHLNWRQQRLRDLIEDLLVLICPEQHPMLSVTTRQSPSCSVLIKLQQHSSMTEQMNSTYSALLNLQSPSLSKDIEQQFTTYSLLFKLKKPMMAKQQSLVYSTLLKLQQPPMPEQSSCLPMITTPSASSEQQSIAFVSEHLIHNPETSNYVHRSNDQVQEKRRLSIGDGTDDNCKRLKSSSKKRSLSPLNSVSYKRAVPALTKNTGIDKSIPIINLVDSDDDIEKLDSDSSTESSNEASFGVQVSEKSPLTIKIIKKKPLSSTQPIIKNIVNKSEIHAMNSKIKENIISIDLTKDLEKTTNEYLKETNKTRKIEGEDFNKLKSNKDEDNKTLISEQIYIEDVEVTGTSVHTTIVSRPTQIAVLVNRPKETSPIINKPSVDNNQILKVAVVECTSSMITNVGSKCINVVPGGRNTIKMMGGVIDPTYVNSVDRTISVISKLTEAAVSVIRKTPMAMIQNHQPAVGQIPTPIITPIEKSNTKMTKSIDQSRSSNGGTENTKNVNKSKIVTSNHRCRIGPLALSKTVRRFRRLNRTLSLETRGPAVPTFRDHGFAQGTIEQVVHGRFVTTIMTMSAAYTIASYIPPPLPRIPFDYASIYKHVGDMASTAKGNSNSNVDNTSNNENIKSANTPLTPLSAVMGLLEKTVETSSNIACGNGHIWKGCARASGPTLMTLSKVTKEAITRNTAIQSRTTSSSHLTTGAKAPSTIPARMSRSSRKKPIPMVTNSIKRSVSATVPTSSISNSNGKQQITNKRSTSLTSIAKPSSMEIMTPSSTSSIKKAVVGLSSSPQSVGLHNRSKSATMVASSSRIQQSNSVVQPTKRSASVAFSSVPILTSEITTDIAVPALKTKISTSTIVAQPHKRSKSAVTTTNTSTINVSPTLTKPSQLEERLRPVKRSASEYVSPSLTSKISDLSPPAVKPAKRSKSAVDITPVTEAAAVSRNNFIQPRPIKRSASMALSPPSVQQTNKSKSAVGTPLSFDKTLTLQTGPTLVNATVPGPRVSRKRNVSKPMPPAVMFSAAPNDAKNNVVTNKVIETGNESETTVEKTTTITDVEQRTVTVTRTLCPTIPAPMDVTADACSLVTAACEQFIKAMIMERHLKAGRGAGTLQLRRRDAFAAAIAVDDEIRPFPDYCRTPVIGTTIANPMTPAYAQGDINDVYKEPGSEQKSIITDGRCDTKFIVMTLDKPDHTNERRSVLKQQSIIADSKSSNKLSVLTVKTVIETQTTSSTTTAINKLLGPTTSTTNSAVKTRSSRSVVEGTSARTRGTMILKKTRSLASTSEPTMSLSSKQPTTVDQLSAEPTFAGKRAMSSLPVIAPETTTNSSAVVNEATKTLPELLPDTMLTFKTSTSTRGFFVQRSRPLLRPTFNRRQPFGPLVATCTMAATDSTSANNMYFSDDRGQDLGTQVNGLNDDPFTDIWGCYFGNQKMLPPFSRLNNFLNIADKPEMPSSENYDVDGGSDDDTTYLTPPSASPKLSHDIRKVDDNSAQEQVLLSNSRQQLILMEVACQQQQIDQLEEEMERRVQEYQNREPDSEEVYYQKFLKLQFGSTNIPPEHSRLRLSPNSHSRHSLVSW